MSRKVHAKLENGRLGYLGKVNEDGTAWLELYPTGKAIRLTADEVEHMSIISETEFDRLRTSL